MPPRFAYWTIIAGGQPTAFRAATQEELLPTLKQLQSKHPDAVMRWFSRGKLWESPAEATTALREQRAAGKPRRGPAWRPGGEHQDPRERFKIPRDVKRQRFAARRRRDAIDARPSDAPPERPQGPKEGRPWKRFDRPFRPKGDSERSGGFRGRQGSGGGFRGGPKKPGGGGQARGGHSGGGRGTGRGGGGFAGGGHGGGGRAGGGRGTGGRGGSGRGGGYGGGGRGGRGGGRGGGGRGQQ